MARMAIEAMVVIAAQGVSQQMTLTASVKGHAISTFQQTDQDNVDSFEALGKWLYDTVGTVCSRQGSIYWESEEHPFQLELPF